MEVATASPSTHQDLESLIRTYQTSVWRYLRLLGADPAEADDLMQETFLRAAGQIDGGRRLQAPLAFLRTVARNVLFSSRRQSGRRPPTVEWSDAVEQLIDRRSELLADQRLDALRACLPQLKGRARQAIELHYLQALDYREVGRHLDLSPNGIKALLWRTRKALRACTESQLRKDPS